MIRPMTRDQVKEALDRVLDWPEQRQEDVAEILKLMEEQDRSELRLSSEQATEVKRRLADANRTTISAEDVFQRFRAPDT